MFRSKSRYLISFLIGTFVFLMVFGISYSLSYLEFQRISSLQGNLAYDIFSHRLDYSLFDKPICNEESFDKVSKDLNFQGRIIDDLENKLGKNDKNVLFRKKFYTLIELEHFDFVNLLNEKCGFDIQTILFFYSNKNKDGESSEELGKLLSTVYRRNENLMIYSFDINLDSEIIGELKNKFGIDEPLTLIINGEDLVVNPENINDIESHLN